MVVVLALSSLVYAQSEGRPLHEYFQSPASYDDLRKAPDGTTAAPLNNELPPSQKPSRTPGDPPPLTLASSDDEPILAKDGPKSAEEMPAPQGGLDPFSAENSLDSQTDKVDELNYYSSFDPSVIPYKRGVAQNSVRYADGQYIFSVDAGRLRQVNVEEGASSTSSEDTFWGTFLLKAESGVYLPVPSVSASQRILEIKSEPAVPVEVFRDRADNYMLRIAHNGLVRVNMKIAAPNAYFTSDFSSTSWSSLDASQVIELPGEARRQASRVLAEIGVGRTMSPRNALMELIMYFRGFEGKPLDVSSLANGDLYYQISMAQTGVCRHRSFAFVVTASALGIPTRYVYNEAHAFVEVLWPGVGWRRIDLGGAAQDIEQHSAQDNNQRVHDPGKQDNLPQPEAFISELERFAEQQEERRQQENEELSGDGTNGGFDIEDGPMNAMADTESDMDNPFINQDDNITSDDDPEDISFLDPTSTDDPSLVPEDVRAQAVIQLGEMSTTLRRGQSFKISGSLYNEAQRTQGLANQKVRIILVSPSSSSTSNGREIGTLNTNAQGRFDGEVTIPRTLPFGRWSLFVIFDGDTQYKPAQSR